MNAREFAVSKSTGLRKRGFGASPAASGSGVPASSRVPSTTSRHAARTGRAAGSPNARTPGAAIRSAADKSGIQLAPEPIAAEFHIKIPQHFGLGQDERPIRGVRNRPQEILRQPEQRLEGARQPRRWCQCRCRCRCRCRQLGAASRTAASEAAGTAGGGGRGGGGGGGGAAMRRCGGEERAADHRGAPAVATHGKRLTRDVPGSAVGPRCVPRRVPGRQTIRTPGSSDSTRSVTSVRALACGLSTVSTARTLASMPSRRMSNRW